MLSSNPSSDIVPIVKEIKDKYDIAYIGLSELVHIKTSLHSSDLPKYKEICLSDLPNTEINLQSFDVKLFQTILYLTSSENLTKDSIIMLDNVDGILHPKQQIKLGKILALLYKDLGVNIVIVTNSPYTLSSINGHMEDYKLDDDLHFYLLDSEKDKYNILSSINSYMEDYKLSDDLQFSLSDIDNEQCKNKLIKFPKAEGIFKSFARAFQELESREECYDDEDD